MLCVDVPEAIGEPSRPEGFTDLVTVGLIRDDGELDLDPVGVAEPLELAEWVPEVVEDLEDVDVFVDVIVDVDVLDELTDPVAVRVIGFVPDTRADLLTLGDALDDLEARVDAEAVADPVVLLLTEDDRVPVPEDVDVLDVVTDPVDVFDRIGLADSLGEDVDVRVLVGDFVRRADDDPDLDDVVERVDVIVELVVFVDVVEMDASALGLDDRVDVVVLVDVFDPVDDMELRIPFTMSDLSFGLSGPKGPTASNCSVTTGGPVFSAPIREQNRIKRIILIILLYTISFSPKARVSYLDCYPALRLLPSQPVP